MANIPTLVRSAPPGGGYLEGFDVSPDGRWIASSDDQNRMHLYDATTNRLLRSYDAGRPPGDAPASITAAFSPDSSQLAVILTDCGVRRAGAPAGPDHHATHGDALAVPGGKPVRGVRRPVQRRRPLPGGHRAHDALVGVTRVTRATPWSGTFAPPPAHPKQVPTGMVNQGMALSPDGQTLYTSWPADGVRRRFGRHGSGGEPDVVAYPTLDVNRQGPCSRLRTYEMGRTRCWWTRPAATRSARFVDTGTGLRDIQFSPDGSRVGAGVTDGELIVWDTATGRPLERWDTFDPWGVGFSPDNDLVYGGGGDSMLRTWDLSEEDTYLQQTTQVGEDEVFAHADFSPDGQQVAYRWLDNTGYGLDPVRRQPHRRGDSCYPPPGGRTLYFNAVGAWHPEGGQYAG